MKLNVISDINKYFNDFIKTTKKRDSISDYKQIYLNFIEKIKNIITLEGQETFYQLYIINFIYLEIKDFDILYENYKKCITLYNNLDATYKKIYLDAYLLSKYYVIMLDIYFGKDFDRCIVESLKEEIGKSLKSNFLLQQIYTKLNRYLYFKLDGKDENYLINILDKIDKENDEYSYINKICELLALKIYKNNEDTLIESLSHYTNIKNSFDILKGKELYVSKYDFLNDKSEVKYIVTLLEQANLCLLNDEYSKYNIKFTQDEIQFVKIQLEFVIKLLKPLLNFSIHDIIVEKYNSITSNLEINNRNIDNILENIKEEVYKFWLDEEEQSILKEIHTNFFVLSFCKDNDSLAMWGNYTKFSGCNITFNSKKFISNLEYLHELKLMDSFLNTNSTNSDSVLPFSTFYYGKVLYDREEIISKLLKDIKVLIEIHKKHYKSVKPFMVARTLINLALLRGLFSKVDSFKYEEEYRIVFSINEDILSSNLNFRSNEIHYVPFIKIPFEYNSINEIVVAPLNYSDLAIKGIKEYLQKQNIDINVKKSELNFR